MQQQLTSAHITNTAADTTRPQRKRATNEHMEEQSGERNVDSTFQKQLDKDTACSI